MKKLIFTTLVLALGLQSISQSFSVPLEGFSRKKIAYLTMEDGTVNEGLLGGFKRSKGLIETVKMKSEEGGKIKIDPAEIKFMYVPASAIAKYSATMDQATNSRKWDSDVNYNTDLLDKGYVYFEKIPTKVKKKTNDLMMQLLNASFSSKIKVYHDPFAKESLGVGVGGVTVAGGLDKSYYIMKVGVDKAAYKLEKKNYKELFSTIFGDCEELMAKYKDSIKWSELEKHIADYTAMTK